MTTEYKDGNLTRQLEALLDRYGAGHPAGYGMHALLLDLAFIAGEKAEHLRSNWQDPRSAKLWDHASQICDKAQARVAC